MEKIQQYDVSESYHYGRKARAYKINRIKEKICEKLILLFTMLSATMIIFIFTFILQKSWNVFMVNGIGFLTQSGFDQQIITAFNSLASERYWEFGLRNLVVGTLTTTLGALCIAVPMGVGTAIVISEMLKGWQKTFMISVVRLLAAIPSVIFGFIGLMLVVPYIRDTFITVDMQIDYLEYFQLSGRSMLAGILVLAFMIIPIIVALSVDAINAVPRKYREAALSLGLSNWRTLIKVVLPTAKSGIIAGIILGTGRGIGEAIALSMVSGSIGVLPNPTHGGVFFLTPVLPLASAIVNKSEAISVPSIESALFGCGVVLLITTTLLSVSARTVEKIVRRRQGLV
ncbi:phosphate ABC transport system permease protein PstC [Clostridium aceticum]|uniref:Phosphate transport system permease protein n=1 Tax=Clostridium aceticum TaxID=84022 RepID=A0A0D8IBL2_9CLOT|nr:phosphate ABC transporter permease subunit PstC [Clostridium aceticum]AKL94733.1 phosphate ABC transport system permease protein PstC [Clostridium aceticum]KJF27685.1 hypothetical protein TZ02_03470 [Clostridium aceticum]